MPYRSNALFRSDLGQNNRPDLIKSCLLSMASLVIASVSIPALAQAPEGAPEETPEATPTTVCAFNPEGDLVNPLGMRAFLTISEIDGDSVFVYEQFPSTVASSDDVERGAATIESVRTLTLFDTSIDEARQQVVDDPIYFAELTGISVDAIGDEGFSEINEALSCDEVASSTESTPAPESPPAPTASFADLPDGNYRLTSADFPFRIVSTQELLESDGTVFLFRKQGNRVVGSFGYPETDNSICISGTIEGNVVTGQAVLESTEATIPEAPALTISNRAAGGRSMDAALNLNGFSRINAGTVLPQQACR